MPIDALMQEHRLIERMISQMRKEVARMEEKNNVNSKFVDVIVDFIRVYADRCHHGKEEGILFRELSSKQMSSEHAAMMRDLINEHVYARKTTGNLAKANESYVNGNGDSQKDVGKLMKDLIEFYPDAHCRKRIRNFLVHRWSTLRRKSRKRCLRSSGSLTEKSSTNTTLKCWMNWRSQLQFKVKVFSPKKSNYSFALFFLGRFSLMMNVEVFLNGCDGCG